MPSRRLVVSGAVAATVLLLSGAAATVHWTAGARWREMAAWAAKARAAYEQRDFNRPVAWGDTHEGNAFVHYRRAMELAQPLQDQDRLVKLWKQAMVPSARVAEPLAAQEAAALRAAWEPALAAMREGAHCAEGGPALDFGQPLGFANLLATRWLVNLSVLDARDAAAAGEPERAVELLLDALTLGTDLLRSPTMIDRMIGCALVAIVVEGSSEALLQQLDRPALDLLAEGCARLDDDALATVAFADDLLVSAHWMLQRQGKAGEGDSMPSPPWHFGFSEQWMTADAVLHLAKEAQRIAATRQPWPVRERLLALHDERRADDDNPMVALMWPPAHAEGNIRGVLAQLRCLRLAVDHHRGVELPELADPLGAGPLQVAREGSQMRFSSVGASGGRLVERRAAVR